LERLSPLNPEILIKDLDHLSRICILSGGTFYFEPPCMYMYLLCFIAIWSRYSSCWWRKTCWFVSNASSTWTEWYV